MKITHRPWGYCTDCECDVKILEGGRGSCGHGRIIGHNAIAVPADLAQAPAPVRVTDAADARFAEWFRKNYPGPDTIIHKPDWHAPKILRAAVAALEAPAPVRCAECDCEKGAEECTWIKSSPALEAPDAGVVAELVEALRFYADAAWKDRPIDPPTPEEIETFGGNILDFPMPEVLHDRGERARAALAKLETRA